MISVEVSALIYPTEDKVRVQSAIDKLFPGLEYSYHEMDKMDKISSRLVGRGDHHSLILLHEHFRHRKILDTARTNMHIERNIITFNINKQVATAGKVSFPPDDEALGSIWVEITVKDTDEAQKVIDWLAPPTESGKPLFEIEL